LLVYEVQGFAAPPLRSRSGRIETAFAAKTRRGEGSNGMGVPADSRLVNQP
jgi:hypothetical protein